MNAISRSIRSAEWISVSICFPTLGSPGALVSNVVSSSGIIGFSIALVDPSGFRPRIASRISALGSGASPSTSALATSSSSRRMS